VTPRLYRTTRPLFLAVNQTLAALGIGAVGSPTAAALIGLDVAGLILLDARPTQTRVSRFLPGRCPDALNRLLRTMPRSTGAVMALPLAWAKRRGKGYLCLDDVVVEKAFAKRLPWAGRTYSFAKKRKVYGLHLVVLLWCSADGRWRLPVAFRLWRPKRGVRPARYRTKLQFAEAMLKDVLAANRGRVVTHGRLMEVAWNYDGGTTARLRNHIGALRRKLAALPGGPVRVEAASGVGYRLRIDAGGASAARTAGMTASGRTSTTWTPSSPRPVPTASSG
jgi:hypothetical protein